MDYTRYVGRCLIFLLLAIVFDVTGLVILLLGIFAPLTFWDFFVFTGPLIIFLSLVFWAFWYLGNIYVADEDLLLPQ